MQAEKAETNLITVVEGPIMRAQKFPLMTLDPDTKELVDLDESMLRLLSTMAMVDRFREKGAPSFIIERFDIPGLVAEAGKVCGKRVVEVILDTKLKVHLLIDSPGGFAIEASEIENLLDYAKKRGSGSIAYVREKAQSAACNILLAADRKYCLRNSNVLWHLPSFDGDLGDGFNDDNTTVANEPAIDDIFDERQDAMRIFRSFSSMLRQKSDPRHIKKVNGKLRAANFHEDKRVIFTGSELQELGLIDAVFEQIADLRSKFGEETGIDVSWDEANKIDNNLYFSRIGDFFNRETHRKLMMVIFGAADARAFSRARGARTKRRA